MTTAPHASLATSLGIDAITIASSDEAYSRGSISVTSRIDTLKSGSGNIYIGMKIVDIRKAG